MAKSHFTRIVLVLALLVSGQAVADSYLKVGVHAWKKPYEQLWWQRGHENEFRNESLLLGLGVSKEILTLSDLTISVNVGAFGVSPYKLKGWAVADEGCNATWGGAPGCGTPDLYITRGYKYGANVGLEISYGKFFVFGGLDRYIQHFSLRVEHPFTTGVVDDFKDHAYGSGWSGGLGYKISKNVALRMEVQHGDAGGKMGGSQFPAGTDDAYELNLVIRK